MQLCPNTASTRQGNRASSSGPVGTRLVCPAMLVTRGEAANRLRYGVTAGSSG